MRRAIKITCIEYGWDTAPSVGRGTALSFTKGSAVDLTTELPVNTLAPGVHALCLRTLSTGHFSQTYLRSFYIPESPHAVEAIEFFFDIDPGVGKGTRMPAALDNEELTKAFNVDVNGLDAGVHQIGIRTLTDGTWSETKVRQFLIRNDEDGYIVHLEYFLNEDPGIGSGTTVVITPGQEVSADFTVDMSGMGEGIYTLGLRAQSGAGLWSNTWYESEISYIIPTGMDSPNVEADNSRCYNIAGQRVEKLIRGLYIKNGKKHFVK